MFRLKKSIFFALSIASAVAMLTSGVSTAEAVNVKYNDSTTETVNTDWQIKDASTAANVLQCIRQTRSKLYDDRSVYFEGMPLQDYVTKKGLTKEQYVNNIQYDRANEEDAYRRAKETRQHGKIAHLGPDGVSEPNYVGRKAWGENLAWGSDAAASMEVWTYGELSALKNSKGHFNLNSGHLYQVLNPDNISFGYGQVDGGPYGEVSALTLSHYHGDSDYPGGKIGAAESGADESDSDDSLPELDYSGLSDADASDSADYLNYDDDSSSDLDFSDFADIDFADFSDIDFSDFADFSSDLNAGDSTDSTDGSKDSKDTKDTTDSKGSTGDYLDNLLAL